MGPERRSTSLTIYGESSRFHFTQPGIQGVSKRLGINNPDRVRDCLVMFIEELYKIKREITQGMKHSFIAQTEAYQLNRDEWMDQLDTAEKRRNLKDLEKTLRKIQTHLTRPGYLSLEARVQRSNLARGIFTFFNDLEDAKQAEAANQKNSSAREKIDSDVGRLTRKGGRVKSEYILLLVRVAIFLTENKIDITQKYPTFIQVQRLASLMSELAQRCPSPGLKKRDTRVWDLTVIDENILRPIWARLIKNQSEYLEIIKEWDPQDYRAVLASCNLDYFREPSLVSYPSPEVRLSRLSKGGKFGFVDQWGVMVIPCKYDDAHIFSEGLASVKLKDQWGFINTKGQEVVPIQFSDARPFFDGVALVQVGSAYRIINGTGSVIKTLNYVSQEGFIDGFARVGLDGKYGFIEQTGKEVIPVKYDFAHPFKNGLAQIGLGSKKGYVDRQGQEYWGMTEEQIKKKHKKKQKTKMKKLGS